MSRRPCPECEAWAYRRNHTPIVGGSSRRLLALHETWKCKNGHKHYDRTEIRSRAAQSLTEEPGVTETDWGAKVAYDGGEPL